MSKPYRDPKHALNKSFRDVERPMGVGNTLARFIPSAGQSNVRARNTKDWWDGLSADDRRLQGAMTLAILKALPRDAANILVLRHSGDLISKAKAAWCLSETIRRMMDGVPDRAYLAAAAMEWGGIKRIHSEWEWADKLGLTTRTLRNWRNGWGWEPGANTHLQALYDEALLSWGELLSENNIIETLSAP